MLFVMVFYHALVVLQTIYDNTCQMREKKLDIEELLTEEKKASEVLKKELESLHKKSKVIDSGLQMAENNLEAFQVRFGQLLQLLLHIRVI